MKKKTKEDTLLSNLAQTFADLSDVQKKILIANANAFKTANDLETVKKK